MRSLSFASAPVQSTCQPFATTSSSPVSVYEPYHRRIERPRNRPPLSTRPSFPGLSSSTNTITQSSSPLAFTPCNYIRLASTSRLCPDHPKSSSSSGPFNPFSIPPSSLLLRLRLVFQVSADFLGFGQFPGLWPIPQCVYLFHLWNNSPYTPMNFRAGPARIKIRKIFYKRWFTLFSSFLSSALAFTVLGCRHGFPICVDAFTSVFY